MFLSRTTSSQTLRGFSTATVSAQDGSPAPLQRAEDVHAPSGTTARSCAVKRWLLQHPIHVDCLNA
ncbi:hypothetical protein L226DRAFT_534247 [Lentinus tigrinus ALCF2SS1-7]|uniref:uncharacterized protein n=1 Tax=Lentinus tigrinus ALCF2SS1-7 TaxID=1328758 RepID=UPI00116636A4|nr:hypothetical protein L226DRAFT_534247 [Lentinus tigrinus ALCF2SS1-7]